MRRKAEVHTPVLIVGGGPSGMVAALCLAQQGIKNIVVEKRERLGKHPKAHEISARTLEILTGLGIPFRELAAEASPHEDAARILFCRTLGEEIGRIDLGSKTIAEKYRMHTGTPEPYLNVSQTEFEKVLRRHILNNRRITLMPGAEWQSMTQTGRSVISLISEKNDRITVIHSDYLIGADGAGGQCRESLGIAMAGPEKIQDFVNAYFTDDLQARLKTRAKLFFIFKPDAVGTFIAHHAGKRWVYHFPIMTPHEKIEDYTEEVLAARIARAMGDESFKPGIESISSWRMTAQVAAAFQNGRAFLIGDAAHRFPPTGGLGLNSGVGDAHNLCWKIALVLKGSAPPSLLESYERERRPVIQANCDQSRDNYAHLFDIARALGLNAGLLPVVYALLSRAPFAWLGPKTRGAILKLLFRLADGRLKRYKTSPRIAARVQSVISNQTSHFDRIGLDLGYSYAAKQDLPAATVYTPTFSIGARLPVFYWARGKKSVMSHDAVAGGKFSLLVSAEKVSAWRPYARRVNIVPVQGQIDIGGKRETFTEAARIGHEGALLIRPDVHIAKRMENPGRISYENIDL